MKKKIKKKLFTRQEAKRLISMLESTDLEQIKLAREAIDEINKIKGLKLNKLNPFYITFTIIDIYCPKRGSSIHQTIIL